MAVGAAAASASRLIELVCRVCGQPATRGWPDGWYCDGDCIEQREWGRKLDPNADGAPSRYCAPTRCYCGEPSCDAFASYRLTEPAVELWRGELHVAAHDERAAALRARAERNLTHSYTDPQLDRIRDEWDTRGEDTWIDKL